MHIIDLLVCLSVQNADYTDYSEEFGCHRREFCTYADVACATCKFTLGENINPFEVRHTQPDGHYSAFAKWAFAKIPLVRLLHRFKIATTVCHS